MSNVHACRSTFWVFIGCIGTHMEVLRPFNSKLVTSTTLLSFQLNYVSWPFVKWHLNEDVGVSEATNAPKSNENVIKGNFSWLRLLLSMKKVCNNTKGVSKYLADVGLREIFAYGSRTAAPQKFFRTHLLTHFQYLTIAPTPALALCSLVKSKAYFECHYFHKIIKNFGKYIFLFFTRKRVFPL